MKHCISRNKPGDLFLHLVSLSMAICFVVCVSYAQKNFVAPNGETLAPPKTKVEAVTETLHGITVTDPYRWLEDQNSPLTRDWLNGQIEYTQSILSTLPGRESIDKRVEQLIKIDTVNPPRERGGRYFFSKRLADQDQPIIYVRENGRDSILIDPQAISNDRYTSVGLEDVSNDGKTVIYGIRKGGKDEVEVKILDVDTRKELSDRMPEARYFGISLINDKTGFYYSRYGSEGSRVYFHKIGTDPSEDRKLFGDGYGPGEIIGTGLSEDGRYLIIGIRYGSSSDKTDIYLQDLRTGGPIVPIIKDIKAYFNGSDITPDGHFFLETNLDAPNKKIIDIDLKNPARENWRTVIPEGKAVIDSFSLVGGKLFVNYLENVHSRISLYDTSGKHLRDIELPSLGTANGPFGRINSDEAFYTFDSFAQPTTIFRYDLKTGKQEEWARINVPVDSKSIEVKQVFY
ncbi:MAG: prolyl oligopeptidase family serine peptidase, partial [Pyrinomonadaceae bacterium]